MDLHHSTAAYGLNTYLDCDISCNSNCKFCIAKTDNRFIGNVEDFMYGMTKALEYTQLNNGTVQITGGEPTISPRFITILNELSNYSFRRIVLNTNGSYINYKTLIAIEDSGVTNINVSRHHSNDRYNQELMRFNTFYSNDDFVVNMRNLSMRGLPIRLQCNLVTGYIENIHDIITYIKWANSLNIRDIMFSQMFPTNSLGYYNEVIQSIGAFTDKYQINLKKLFSDLQSHPDFSLTNPEELDNATSVWGSGHVSPGKNGKLRLWRYKNTNIAIKTLSGYDKNGIPKDTYYNPNEDPELQDNIISFIVVHPDGTVTASWDISKRIIYSQASCAFTKL
jgi:pyruvate-formate lyase-activating enzyme